MHLRTVILLFAPSVALAAGAEDTEFYARTSAGTLIKAIFMEDGQPWSKRNFIYGSKASGSFAFCWTEKVNEVRQSFVCAPSRGAGVNLTYTLVQNPDTVATSEYKQLTRLAKLGDGTQRGDGTLEAVYACKSGCSSSVPRFVFEVTKYD